MRPGLRPRVALLAVVLAAGGCDEETGGAVRHSVLAVCLRVERPLERVFRSADEWRSFAAPVARGPVPEPDFGQVMVAAHFDGGGSACVGFTVEAVEERGDEIVVEATRHSSPDACIAVLAYPQLVLTLERRDVPVRFQIRDVVDRTPGAVPACT